VRSLTRVAIATGRSAIDRGVRPDKFVARTWPDDGDVALILHRPIQCRSGGLDQHGAEMRPIR
jgi:hypothetical protein